MGRLALSRGRGPVDSDIVTVGPHASWDGTADTGAGDPGDGTRVTAKAITAFTVVPYQRMAAGEQFSLRVKHRAFGGEAGVRFSGDCVDTMVSTPAVVNVPHRLGGTRPELVYEIKLDADAYLAKNAAGGAITIYAEGLAVDGTVAKRRLTFALYVAPALYDWDKEFSLDGRAASYGGASYTGLRAGMDAMMAAITGGAKNVRLRCIQTGSYNATDCTSGYSGYVTATGGWATIGQIPGVTCRIMRASLPNLNDLGTWSWFTGINGVHWQDVTIDNAYLTKFKSHNNSNRPDWYDGVKWTDSLGRDRLMEGFQHAGRGAEGLQSTGFEGFYTDCYCEEGNSPFQYAQMAIGIRTYRIYGDTYSGARLVMGTYDKDSTSTWFRTTLAAMTVQYAGSGVGTIARFGANGGFNGSGGLTIVDAVGTATIQFERYASNVNIGTGHLRTWDDLKSWFDARGNWTTTKTDTSGRLLCYCTSSFGNDSWSAKDAKTSSFALTSFVDVHGDWYQSGTRENIIISGCCLAWTNTATADYSGGLFMGLNDDVLIENLIMDCKYSNNIEPGGDFRHLLLENCDMIYKGITPYSGVSDTHIRVANNVLVAISSGSPDAMFIQDNYAAGDGGAPNFFGFGTGANTSGNFGIGTSFADQFVDLAGKDYRKAGAVLSTLKPYVSVSMDIFGNVRSANDVDGAVSKNHAVGPAWPTFPMAA